jgi:hypothetical protein
MSFTKCLICISAPGTSAKLESNPYIGKLIRQLDKKRIKWQKVDSMMGWGCLNQDWIEFTAPVLTSYGWCEIKGLEYLTDLFIEGKLLMSLCYIKEVPASVEHIQHH